MQNKVLEGLLIDVSYHNENNSSIIDVYVSTEKDIVVFSDKSFKPYFYVISKNPKESIEAIKNHYFENSFKAIEAEEVKKDNAEGIIKVVFNNTQELVKAREEITYIKGVTDKREFDIPFTDRYLIDKALKPMQGVSIVAENRDLIEISHDLRIMSLDIETYSPGRFSNPKKDPVLLACLCTNKEAKVFTYKDSKEKFVLKFSSEKEMLEQLLKAIREYAPDILVTYNGDTFDLPYIKSRCEQLKIDFNLGFSGIKEINMGMHRASEIVGTQHLDAFVLIKFMARIGAISLLKFDLENVSEKVFGKPKEKLPSEQINELWDKNEIDKIVTYNKEDAEATLKIAQEFLPLQLQLCAMLHQTIFDTSRMTSSQMVEQLLIIRSTMHNRLIPNKPSDAEVQARSMQSYEGGFVKEPLAGLHENIAVLDFRSLHPTIMISHNISPETLKCNHEECKNTNISPDKDWFCTKKKGFLAEVLEEILSERIKLKKEAKSMAKQDPKFKTINAKQHALKILLNSHYGYLGYARARWYSRECARAVTAWSRHYIKDVMAKAENEGYKVIYGDTDSLFFIVPQNKNQENVKEFIEKTNKQLPEAMELELEGFYKRGIFVTKESGKAAKKKYALIDYYGNLKIVGFEYVRHDWAPIAKNTQKRVIEAILKEGNPAKAVQITKEVIEHLKSGKVPKKELVIMKQLKARPEKYESLGPHVWAAKKAIERGKKIDVGTLIGFIVKKGNNKKISDKAEMEEYVKEGDYDAEYYIENQILQAVLKITKELGYDKEDLLQGGKQSSLFKFSS
ncbi:MAG: DNA-directed DNA polymerase [Candidatus Diapherotrites archaeon]